MSPYRVIIKDNTKTRLLVAMLSVESITKRRRIFIMEKTLPQMWTASPDEIRHVAHMQITRKNALTLAEYTIYKDPLGLKYEVSRRSGEEYYVLPRNQYIQSDCLVAAMNDYTERNGLEIAQQI